MDEPILFYRDDLGTMIDLLFSTAAKRVDEIPEARFLNASDDALINHVLSEFEIRCIELHQKAAQMKRENIELPGIAKSLIVIVSIPYTGSYGLWNCRPNQFQLVFPRGMVQPPDSNGIGCLELVIEAPSSTEPEFFKQELDRRLIGIQFYLHAQRAQIEQRKQELPGIVQQAVLRRREQLKRHTAISQVLGIPEKGQGVPPIVQIPVQRRLVRPLPTSPNKPPEPGIFPEVYEDILGVIRDSGRSFEMTPLTFVVHDEEELRDFILAHLNTAFSGRATAEAFRVCGKTDIRIEEQNRAAFVAECKVWHGAKELSEAVDQLLGYLTWRDCKAAIVLFNKDIAGFSDIQKKAPEVIAMHQYHLKTVESGQAGEWRFVLRSKDDPDRHVTVHAFLFNLYVAKEGAKHD